VKLISGCCSFGSSFNGRYPDAGWVTNLKCKELAYVIRGVGKLVVEGNEVFLSNEGYEVINVSNQTPFQQSDGEELSGNADDVIMRYFPWAKKEFSMRGWSLPKTIDRVYAIEKAKKILGYKPSHNFSEWFTHI
jgi:nucleoside-diphosphate-sugar epimerase